MKFAAGFIAALVLLLCGALIATFSGWYNVAALQGMHPLFAWALHTTMENSVRSRAASITPVPDLPALAPQGFRDFNEMCVQCHGAPGKQPEEIGQGLAPKPPSLKEVADRWTPAEVFWIVKNGVHMTGMPAFGPTHDDARIWRIVAFVKSLPAMTAEQYRTLQGDAEKKSAPHGDTGRKHH